MDITRIGPAHATSCATCPLFPTSQERGRQRRLHLMGLLLCDGACPPHNRLFALLEMPSSRVANVLDPLLHMDDGILRHTAAVISYGTRLDHFHLLKHMRPQASDPIRPD